MEKECAGKTFFVEKLFFSLIFSRTFAPLFENFRSE
jgi:hypothetical protein